MVVELTRALYGCVESAHLWFNDLSSFLESIGFKSNPYDSCVFSKTLSNGDIFDIAVYVDDLLLGCKNLEVLKEFIAQLKNKYHDVTLNQDKVQEYLGMALDFSEPGVCSINMEVYIAAMITDFGISKFATTPANANLFTLHDSATHSYWRLQGDAPLGCNASHVRGQAGKARHTTSHSLPSVSSD